MNQGVLQYEAELMLRHCIQKKYFFMWCSFFTVIETVELGYMEADSRPIVITSQILNSPDK